MAYEEYTLLEFQRRFQTEGDCEKQLEAVKWPDGFICPRCRCQDGCRLTDRREIQCSQCKHQTSVTAGTMFHKTHTPLLKWFWAMYLVSQDKGGLSATRLSRLVGVSRPTAWLMLQKIRKAMGQRDERYQLAGYIEFDQGVFGRAATAKKPEKADNQSDVLVMIESKGEKAGFISMQVIDSISRDNMRPIIEQKVKPGQSFRSDGLQANYVLKSMGHELKAGPVPPEEICIELPWVHIAISLAKRFLLGTYHGVSSKHLQCYLDEFCYRFNRRFVETQLFSRLVTACVGGTPFTYATITAT